MKFNFERPLRVLLGIYLLAACTSCSLRQQVEQNVTDTFTLTFQAMLPVGGSLTEFRRARGAWPDDLVTLQRFLAKDHKELDGSAFKWLDWARRMDGSLEVFGRIQSGRDFRFLLTARDEVKSSSDESEVILRLNPHVGRQR